MGAARIAIWNRDKIIFTIVMGIWLANLGFLIHSKSILLLTGNRISYECGVVPGVVIVSN